MKNRKVWKILSSLKVKEAESFRRWLDAEMGNKQVYLRKLAEILCKDLNNPPCDQAAWDALYPGKAYDDDRLRKLCGDLTTQLEEYLAILAFRKDRDARDLYLVRELNQRKRPEIFVKTYRKVYRKAKRKVNRNSNYYRMLYELEVENQGHHIAHRIPYAVPNQVQTQPNSSDKMSLMQRANYVFDSWWLHEKMELARHNINTEKKYGERVESVLLEETLKLIDNHPVHSRQAWLIINKSLYRLLAEDQQGKIIDFIRLLQDNRFILTRAEQQAIISFLISHYMRELNRSGSIYAANDALSLYDWAIEKRFILINDYLSKTSYKNIITCCLIIPDYDRAWGYLHSLKPLLPPKEREDLYVFSTAKYYFEKRAFSKVIEQLSHYKFNDVLDEMDARSLLLKAHFEQYPTEQDWLFSQAETLIRYIRKRKNIAPGKKQAYINQFRLMKRIINAQSDVELDKVLQTVKETRPLSRPEWLKSKIEEKKLRESKKPAGQ